ncbi:MAG: ATP-binding protein [Bacteroidota bacterium]
MRSLLLSLLILVVTGLTAQGKIDSLRGVVDAALAGDDADAIVAARTALGREYDAYDNLPAALQEFEAAQQLLPRIKDEALRPRLYYNIARVYRYQAEYSLADQYYRLAITNAPATLPDRDLALFHSGLGYCSTVHDTAVFHHQLAVKYAEKVAGDAKLMSTVLESFGSEYVYRGRYEEALRLMREAANYAGLSGDSLSYFTSQAQIGRIHQLNGKPALAVAPTRRAYDYIMRQPGLQNQLSISSGMASAYAAAGQYAAAYRHELEASRLLDSLYSTQVASSLAEANVRFETVEREARLAEQELEISRQRNTRNRLLFGALALLVLVGGIFQYFLQRNRLRRRELALEVDKREAEAAQLRELDGLKTRFFTNISHELRTPLTLITSPLEEAIGRLKQINLKPDLELAHRNSRNLLTLVNEILDLGKLEAGQLAKNEVAFAPEPTLRRFLHAFESLADLREVSLAYVGPFPPEERLETDLQKLEKIINNLVSNALKFSPADGTISLTATRENDQLIVAVTDQGPGIAPQEQERVFDRYYQSSDNAPHQTGTGIGLNLARRLARYLGGDLSLESTVGKGSTFTLRLPVVVSTVAAAPALDPSPAPAAAPEEMVAPVWQPATGQARLLIVEDNVEMAAYLERHLRAHYTVTTVATGTAALAALSRETFDLISSDVMMPGMDGFELRERINARPQWRGIPFLLLTARNLEEDVLRGFRLGIDDYVTKPFRLPEYQARINSLLQNRAVRAENQVVEEVTTLEDDLVQRAEALVRARLADTTFTVEEMARELGHGQRQLSRLLGAATGLTPVKFILELRLQKARELLESGGYATVAEVRYAIGIESASYFSRKFTERFGRNPGDVLR